MTSSCSSPVAGWAAIDPGLLAPPGRPALPAFPLDALPPGWARWLTDTASRLGVPVDYVALGLFAAVAGVSGAGIVAEPRRGWREPLVQWLCLLGASGAGKSPALAAVRGLVTGRHRRCLLGEGSLPALASAMAASPRGAVLWRDELAGWIGAGHGAALRGRWREAWDGAPLVLSRGAKGEALRLDRFALSVVGGLQPELLARTLRAAPDGLAARFLFAGPEPVPWQPFGAHGQPDDAAAETRLARIADLAGVADHPVVLPFDGAALAAFEPFAAARHGEAGAGGGTMSAWCAKGPGTVARLAALLALLAWSEGEATAAPVQVGAGAVKAAVRLWSDYFRPHAQAALGEAGRAESDAAARRVVGWLRDTGAALVAREDVRVSALGRAVDAAGADAIIARLEQGGVLRRRPAPPVTRAGRPPTARWEVVPALAADAANTANTANPSENGPSNEEPARRKGTIEIDLPTLEDADDRLYAQTEIIDAVSHGNLTPDEGLKMSRLLQWHSRARDNVYVSEAFDAARALFFTRARAERERLEQARKGREERERRRTSPPIVPPAAISPVVAPPPSLAPPQVATTSDAESRPESPPAPVVVRAGEPAAAERNEEEEKQHCEPPPPRPWFEEMLVDHSARGGLASRADDWSDDDEEDGRNGRALCDYDPLDVDN